MLTENDIIDILARHLEQTGYTIKQKLTTIQTGIDLIAENGKETLYVEAKGETSSKETTKRFGFAFDSKQIKSHVSRSILASMLVLNDKPAGPRTKVAIAVPDTTGHRNLIMNIIKPLRALNIRVFLISAGGKIDYL